MTPLQRSALLAALKAGLSLPDAAKQTGLTAAEVRRQMAADGPAGAALSRDVAAAVAVGERAALGPAWAGAVAASAAAQEPEAPRPTGTGLGYPAPVSSKRAAEHTDDGSPDWSTIRADAESTFGPGLFGLYQWQDERLVSRSGGRIPSTSAWWLKTIREFFESKRTWLVAMVGRGAGKSSNLERLMLIVVIFVQRVVPDGQPWTAPFMSVLEKDAYRRIVEIKSLIELAYGVEIKIKGQAIEITDCSGNAIEIVSTAATIGQTSGPTTVAAFFDEAAKMHTAAGAANRDTELIASIVGTSREQLEWMGVRCSSAWETRGAHFANCMEGTNSENYVATIGADFLDHAVAGYEEVARWESAQGNSHGAARIRAFARDLHAKSPYVATWVARPSLGALRSRLKLETLPKDDPELEGLSRFDYWIREYGSMPLSTNDGADYSAQCLMAGAMTAAIHERLTGRPAPSREGEPMRIPGTPPGDGRYAGPPVGGAGRRDIGAAVGSWKTRRAL